ncbi:MAG: hypothetical protein ACREDR_31615 [Blastocatellia bacterium]
MGCQLRHRTLSVEGAARHFYRLRQRPGIIRVNQELDTQTNRAMVQISLIAINQSGGQCPNYPGGYLSESGGYFPNQPGGYPRQSATNDDIPIVAPYAAPPEEPGASYSSDPRHWVWRQGKTLVFHQRAELPDRCIKCNEPARGCRLKKRLAWHHPAWVLLVLVGIVIYLIVAAVLRKRATVNLGFCTRHLRQRQAWMAAGWLLLVGGLAVLYLALILQSGPTAFAGLGLLLVSITASVITRKFIGLKKIENQRVWLKNVDERFLAQFPPLG